MDTGSRCDECGFSWSTPFAFAVDTVLNAPERYAELFGAVRAPLPSRPGVWTPAQYLWHVVDVLRFGVERLWTLDLDPAAGAMPWDENEAMAVRARSPHSVPVGLHTLGRLVEEWAQAAWDAPAGTTLAHPDLGPLSRDDVVHRNCHEVVHHELDVRLGLGLATAL